MPVCQQENRNIEDEQRGANVVNLSSCCSLVWTLKESSLTLTWLYNYSDNSFITKNVRYQSGKRSARGGRRSRCAHFSRRVWTSQDSLGPERLEMAMKPGDERMISFYDRFGTYLSALYFGWNHPGTGLKKQLLRPFGENQFRDTTEHQPLTVATIGYFWMTHGALVKFSDL